MNDELDTEAIEMNLLAMYGDITPEGYFASRRQREVDGWYMPVTQAAALVQWDRMMAAHDAQVRADALEGARSAVADLLTDPSVYTTQAIDGVVKALEVIDRARAASIREDGKR